MQQIYRRIAMPKCSVCQVNVLKPHFDMDVLKFGAIPFPKNTFGGLLLAFVLV